MEPFVTRALDWAGNVEGALSGIAALAGLVGLVAAGVRKLAPRVRTARDQSAAVATTDAPAQAQDVQFCRSVDGVRIAYAVTGPDSGLPIVRSLGWFSHLDVEWETPIGRNFWLRLSRQHPLIRYDGRGMGLSEKTTEFSGRTRLVDLESVIDASAVDRFALLAISEGCRTAIRYAAQHPDRVSHLILYGAAIWKDAASNAQVRKDFVAHSAMIQAGWGRDSHRRFFADLFLGAGASVDEINYLMEMQKRSATPDVAYAYYRSLAERDQGFELAQQLAVPTLILHPKDDQMCPYESSLDLASVIPGAKLKTLDGDCHYLMLDTKRSQAAEYVAAVEAFLAERGA